MFQENVTSGEKVQPGWRFSSVKKLLIYQSVAKWNFFISRRLLWLFQVPNQVTYSISSKYKQGGGSKEHIEVQRCFQNISHTFPTAGYKYLSPTSDTPFQLKEQ